MAITDYQTPLAGYRCSAPVAGPARILRGDAALLWTEARYRACTALSMLWGSF